MSFIHYGQILNSYDKKTHWMKKLTNKFIVQHKYDGCNFQIIFSKEVDKPTINIQYASRNRILSPDEKFYDYVETVRKYQNVIDNVSRYLAENSDLQSINLYGEMYGHVLTRIAYNKLDPKTNNLIFFDVLMDGDKQCPKVFIEWATKMNIPIVETFLIGSIDQCLQFDVENVSSDCYNMIEGVVIKSYDTKPVHILKKKSIKFCEIEKIPKPTECESNRKPESFENYLTLNRVQNVFVKDLWEPTNRNKLVDTIMKDAFEEYCNDLFNFYNDKKNRNKIFSMINELKLFK